MLERFRKLEQFCSEHAYVNSVPRSLQADRNYVPMFILDRVEEKPRLQE